MLKCTIAGGDKVYKQSAGAGDSATMPPPLHRSCDETCYTNGKITTLNERKPLIRVKLLTFSNEEQFLDSKFVTYCEMPKWEASTYVCAVETPYKKLPMKNREDFRVVTHFFCCVKTSLHSTKHNIFSARIIHWDVMNFITSYASWHIHMHHNGIFRHLQHFMAQACSLHNEVQHSILINKG